MKERIQAQATQAPKHQALVVTFKFFGDTTNSQYQLQYCTCSGSGTVVVVVVVVVVVDG
jgi:hypothetical protein